MFLSWQYVNFKNCINVLEFGCEGGRPLYRWFITRRTSGFNVALQLYDFGGFVQL